MAQSERQARVLDVLLVDGLGDGGVFIAVHVRGYLLRVRTDGFRQEMIGILKDMVRSYETGENTMEE